MIGWVFKGVWLGGCLRGCGWVGVGGGVVGWVLEGVWLGGCLMECG